MKKFDNFVSHLEVLQRAYDQDFTNEFIISGIIDKFSLQFELGWKICKELLIYEGEDRARTGSPREIVKAAYAYFDFIEEDVWLAMLKDRNDTNHIYNQELADKLLHRILDCYIPAFVQVKEQVEKRYHDILNRGEDL